jgi:hypothetical protein
VHGSPASFLARVGFVADTGRHTLRRPGAPAFTIDLRQYCWTVVEAAPACAPPALATAREQPAPAPPAGGGAPPPLAGGDRDAPPPLARVGAAGQQGAAPLPAALGPQRHHPPHQR